MNFQVDLKASQPKYSIIIPTFNAMGYVQNCYQLISSESRQDFEIIFSDDYSSDGTFDYLRSIIDDRVKVTQPPVSSSMTENWEWASSKASGEWLMFLGQDDALQGYFFELADKLTSLATKKAIRTIASKRSYYFWEGSREYYNNQIFDYEARNEIYTLDLRFHTLLALSGVKSYFDLPQMYTSSIFHKSILDEARLKQQGRLFTSHPQDANLAAIASRLERKFLYSRIPLGWVGSSKKSAGLAVSINQEVTDETLLRLKSEYLAKIKNSEIKYDARAGDFALDNLQIYFWQALLATNPLVTDKNQDKYDSFFAKNLVLGSALKSHLDLNANGDNSILRAERIQSLFRANHSSTFIPRLFIGVVSLLNLLYFVSLVGRRFLKKMQRQNSHIEVSSSADSNPNLGFQEVICAVDIRIRNERWF